MSAERVKSLDPAIVLVEPQLGENIGACARAMLNCGLTDLRLVRPRDGWPNPRAEAAATGAGSVIREARLFKSTEEAVADIHQLFATTSRHRDLLKPVIGPAEAVSRLRTSSQKGGLMFGPERTGLGNDDLVLASSVIQIPLNPDFSSLNLGQAVLLIAYRWFEGAGGADLAPSAQGEADDLASADELRNLFEHLELELEDADFFRVAEKRSRMVRNLRTMFQRASLRSHEVGTLHGVITALTGRRKDGSPARQHRMPAKG